MARSVLAIVFLAAAFMACSHRCKNVSATSVIATQLGYDINLCVPRGY